VKAHLERDGLAKFESRWCRTILGGQGRGMVGWIIADQNRRSKANDGSLK
jgi:hypothetical protein